MQEGLNTRIGFGTITFPVIAVWLAMTAALLRGHVADYRFAQTRLGAITPGLIYESAQSGPDRIETTELARLAEGLVGIRHLTLLDPREQRLGHWAAAEPDAVPGLVGGLLRLMGATAPAGSVRRVVAPEADAGEPFLLEIGLAAPIADPQFVQRFRQLLGLSTGIGLIALAVLILVRVRLSRPAHELELALRRLSAVKMPTKSPGCRPLMLMPPALSVCLASDCDTAGTTCAPMCCKPPTNSMLT